MSSCAHDWIISLTQQEDEQQLDTLLIAAVQSVLSGLQVSIYVKKYLTGFESYSLLNPHPTSDNLQQNHLAPDYVESVVAKLANNKLLSCKLAGIRVTHIPMYHLGQVIGFAVVNGEVRVNEAAPAITLLNIYANQLYLLYRSRLDSFTELLNRQTFDRKLLEIISGKGFLCPREQLSGKRNWHLAMIDIDHFKRVNDNFGHVIGDEVILLIARILKSGFRAEDYVFRYGGEEFAVLFRCDDVAQALDTLERVRKQVAKHKFPQVGHITISIGLTELLHFRDAQSLVQQADSALYQSKHDGRNCITQFVRESKPDAPFSDIELF